MKLLAVNALVILFIGADLVRSTSAQASGPAPAPAPAQAGGTFSTKTWFVKPAHAAYAKGDIAVQSNKGQNAEGTVNKQTLQANMNAQGKGDYAAGRQGNAETVAAKNPKGFSATGDQSKKNPNNGLRTGDAGKYHGDLKNKKSGNDQSWNSDLNTGQKMDTVMHGKGDSFDAAGSKGNKYNVDPDPGQSKTGGKGVITRNGEKYNYQDSKAANGDASAQMTNVGTGTNRKTYTCQGQKQGISNCVDQNGLKFGEVVEQPDGTVIVKKTVSKGVDLPIYKGHAVKDQNGRSVVVVNDGLVQASAGNYKQRDCMSDYGKTTSKVKVEKPFEMKYASESKDGRRVFQFPDCITFGGKITLPPGVDANRLAMQFDVNVLPAGKLKCVDPGACNKDCYYCNLCNDTRKANVLNNFDSRNACAMKGGGTYTVSVMACPPPAQVDKAACTGFTKSDASYWKKKGDVQARIIFYERPSNEQALRDTFYNVVNKNPASKMLLKTQFTIENRQFVNAQNPTDFDLCEYYVKKNGKEEVVGCVEGTTNYTMSGKGVRTDFLLEAGSLAAAPKSLFDNKPCPQVDAINQAEAADEAADSAKRAKPNPFGNFGSFFGG